MTKHYRLHQGDCVEWLASLDDESVDMVDTDPAYESLEKHRAVGTTTRLKESKGSSNVWFPIFRNERFPELFAQMYRVLRKDRHLYMWCDFETALVAVPIGRASGFTFWNALTWVKVKERHVVRGDELEAADVRAGMGYHWRRSTELVLFFEKGKRQLNDRSWVDALPFPRVSGYPTEKPVGLHRRLIENSTGPGEIVVDPFMGSASCGEAALGLDRSFWGCDVTDLSLSIASKRLSKYPTG